MAYFIFTQHAPSHASSQCARSVVLPVPGRPAMMTIIDPLNTIPYEECAIRLLRTLSSRAEPFFRHSEGISPLIGPDA